MTDKKAGLTEIGPTGLSTNETVPKAKKRARPKIEPIMEEIPPWSKNSLTQHAEKSGKRSLYYNKEWRKSRYSSGTTLKREMGNKL